MNARQREMFEAAAARGLLIERTWPTGGAWRIYDTRRGIDVLVADLAMLDVNRDLRRPARAEMRAQGIAL